VLSVVKGQWLKSKFSFAAKLSIFYEFLKFSRKINDDNLSADNMVLSADIMVLSADFMLLSVDFAVLSADNIVLLTDKMLSADKNFVIS
jgi:hypothetical protein